MKVKSPPIRYKFANEWDEVDYLYHQLLYWLYERENASKARGYANRLEQLLPKADPDHQAIFGEECWSLVYETKGNLPKAIEHRKNEIRLIRRLHDISRNAPYEHLILRDYGYDDLSDRLDLLAVLYQKNGQLDQAMDTLIESKQHCEKHGIRFDGEDILQKISHDSVQAKMNSQWDSNGKVVRRSRSPKFREVI
jgi:tetratricopeptide (TPR) repeat protein